MFEQNSNLLTVFELAEILKVKASWLYGQTRQTGPASIPRLKVGKYIRFRLEEVLRWLETRQD